MAMLQTPRSARKPTSPMKFAKPLIETVLERRYKRFLADVRLPDGAVITVHCPNPGAMMGLTAHGSPAWISDSGNPKRKLRHTLELVEVESSEGPTLVGINTNLPNRLAEEAITDGRLPSLAGYSQLRREVRYGENSRIDILLEKDGAPPCYVEVKNVHLVRQAGLHEFPDCKTERGAKHLREMSTMVKNGARAVMLYVVQRADGDRFSLARDLDPGYATAFDAAMEAGVEALAIRCHITPTEIVAREPIPLE